MEDNIKFEKIINIILNHEGGYVNDANDKGGETKFGISKRSYPNVDIKSLSLDDAKNIYKKDFWDKYSYDKFISIEIATKIFDLAVNIGPFRSHKLLQRALNEINDKKLIVDGILGNQTFEATNQSDFIKLLVALKDEAANYYKKIVISKEDQKKFLKGWLSRAYA